jgi:hypothetical protein
MPFTAVLTGIFTLAAVGAMPALALAQAGARLPCDAADTDPFVGELRDRVLAYSGLAAHALDRHGPVVACVGAVSDDFDGMRFGGIALRFEGGVELEVTTHPPESSVSELRAPDGFADPDATIAALRAHVERIGLRIDWSAMEVETGPDGERIERYWDPEPGLNASASLSYADGRLVAVRVGMAL